MSDYMPKCATCEHFESCIMQKHITEMALILWNISREKSGRKEQTMSKKKPCGLDYCPLAELIGEYASCMACAWGNDGDNESEEERASDE